MPRILAAFFLAAIAHLARADVTTFAPIRVAKGYAGPLDLNVVWADGAARDVSKCSAKIIVSQVTPRREHFRKSLSAWGHNQLSAVVTAADTATPGTYQVEIVVIDGPRTDTWHGDLVVEGP